MTASKKIVRMVRPGAIARATVPTKAQAMIKAHTATKTKIAAKTKTLAKAKVAAKTKIVTKAALAPVRLSRADKKDAILDAALDVFASYSFPGASLDRIAERAGMSKANLLYHFGSKEELYVAVLRRILLTWLEPLAAIERSHDPVAAISAYVRIKMQYSRDFPLASRLFCLEITQGAPLLKAELKGPLRRLVMGKTKVIQGWIDDGRLAPVDPYHLIFSIWAITQHYADFSVQIDAIVGKTLANADFVEAAVSNIVALVLNGVRPRSGALDAVPDMVSDLVPGLASNPARASGRRRAQSQLTVLSKTGA